MYTSWALPLELCMLIDLCLCVLLWQLVQYCLEDFFPSHFVRVPPPSIPSPPPQPSFSALLSPITLSLPNGKVHSGFKN